MFHDGVVMEAAEDLRSAAARCAAADPGPLDDELLRALDAVHAAAQLLRTAEAHVVGEIDARRLPATAHATSTSTWLRDHLRMDVFAARALVQQAHALHRRPALEQALTSGAVTADQAAVIAEAIQELPEELESASVDKAEAILVDWAAELEPRQLRKHATRILDHVAPDMAAAASAEALERQRERAWQTRSLKIYPIPYGRVRFNGVLDVESAAVVRAALDPLCAPRPEAPQGYDQRRADALVEVCKLALRTRELPSDGGERPHVTVTIPYDPLTQSLGTGTLDTDDPVTPEQARRLACDAQIMPVVLGGEGQILDVGRSRRLITGSLHKALVARDGGCAFPGCDRPARWCESHHIIPWHLGGRTSLDNAVLVCGHHHRLLHHSRWRVRLGPDRRPEFIPPPYVDRRRRPRRNIYHMRT
jgi:Domain of unknown function (DUF222)/HNH endonuclease